MKSRSVNVLLLMVGLPILFSVLQGLFGGIEGFECWCRGQGNQGAGGTNVSQTAIQPAGTAVVDLGAFNSGGWGVTAANFPDSNARVIWNVSGALSGAPPNPTPVVFSKAYFNPGSAPTAATIYAMVDDIAVVYLNGTSPGVINTCCVVKKIPITLSPGNNVLAFAAQNLGSSPNPAGLLVTVVDANNNVLFHSDSTWTFTAPNPI